MIVWDVAPLGIQRVFWVLSEALVLTLNSHVIAMNSTQPWKIVGSEQVLLEIVHVRGTFHINGERQFLCIHN